MPSQNSFGRKKAIKPSENKNKFIDNKKTKINKVRTSARHLRHSPRLKSQYQEGSIWVSNPSTENRYGFIGRFNRNSAKCGVMIALDTVTANDAVMVQSENCVVSKNDMVVTPKKTHKMECDTELNFNSPGGRKYQGKFFVCYEEAQNAPEYSQLLRNEILDEILLKRLEKSLERMPSTSEAKKGALKIPDRKLVKKRSGTQADVMHISAADYIRVLASKNLVSDSVLNQFQAQGDAYPEWAHGIAISLGGKQAAENLFVVTRACNTEMWIAEHYAHTLNQQSDVYKLRVSFKADLIKNNFNEATHIAAQVKYEITWQDAQGKVYKNNFEFDGFRQTAPSCKTLNSVSNESHMKLLENIQLGSVKKRLNFN